MSHNKMTTVASFTKLPLQLLPSVTPESGHVLWNLPDQPVSQKTALVQTESGKYLIQHYSQSYWFAVSVPSDIEIDSLTTEGTPFVTVHQTTTNKDIIEFLKCDAPTGQLKLNLYPPGHAMSPDKKDPQDYFDDKYNQCLIGRIPMVYFAKTTLPRTSSRMDIIEKALLDVLELKSKYRQNELYLQILLCLEMIHYKNLDAQYKHFDEEMVPKLKQRNLGIVRRKGGKKRKELVEKVRIGFVEHLDLLLDRLSISDAISGDTNETKSFLAYVMIPFYQKRVPNAVAWSVKKLRGSSRKKSAKRAPALVRKPAMSRNTSNLSELLEKQPSIVRSKSDLSSMQKRELDLAAVPVQAAPAVPVLQRAVSSFSRVGKRPSTLQRQDTFQVEATPLKETKRQKCTPLVSSPLVESVESPLQLKTGAQVAQSPALSAIPSATVFSPAPTQVVQSPAVGSPVKGQTTHVVQSPAFATPGHRHSPIVRSKLSIVDSPSDSPMATESPHPVDRKASRKSQLDAVKRRLFG